MGWFITASLVSLTLGLIMVNLLRPGELSEIFFRMIPTASSIERTIRS